MIKSDIFLRFLFGIRNNLILLSKSIFLIILSKIKEREQAKKNGNYNLADKIRDELSKEGIDIKDEKGTTNWNYK